MFKKIVLLTGWGFFPTIWNSFVENFFISVDFIRIDLLDICRSSPTLELIQAELEKLIPQNALIIGWSLGGLFALNFCARYPEKSATLITMGCSPKFIAEDNWPGISPQNIAILSQQLEQDIDSLAKRFTAEVLYPAKNRTVRNTLMQTSCIEKNHQDVLLILLNLLTTLDLRNDFQALAKPSLHLLGNQDALVPASIANQLKQLNAKAQIEIIDNAGHALFLTHPQICFDRIQYFLN
jgi:pimeloyl-ACP methyl ester esterase